jgi:Putative transposase.
MWKYGIIKLFRKQYQKGLLKLPKALNHIKNYKAFNSWLNIYYNKKCVVHLQKSSNNHRTNIDYIGKYLKRPPVGETRIKKYDGNSVTFEYLDHYDDIKK